MRTGIEIVLFSRGPLYSDHLRGIQAEHVAVPYGREAVWSEYHLPRAVRKNRIDVFHAPADRGLPLFSPCPTVVTIHGSFERTHWKTLHRSTKSRAWYWRNEIANSLSATRVITVSQTTANELDLLGMVRPERLSVTYLAPSAQFSETPSAGDQEARKALPEKYFLYAGGYDVHKNIPFLIRSFKEASIPGVHLVVVARKNSAFANLEGIHELAAEKDRVHLVDRPSAQLPAIYRGALAFINPSLWESFSFQIVEAFTSGVPLATSNRGAMPEIAGNAALLFDPADSARLAAILRDLASNASLRTDLIRRGKERAAQFSWKRTVDQTIAVYQSALAA